MMKQQLFILWVTRKLFGESGSCYLEILLVQKKLTKFNILKIVLSVVFYKLILTRDFQRVQHISNQTKSYLF